MLHVGGWRSGGGGGAERQAEARRGVLAARLAAVSGRGGRGEAHAEHTPRAPPPFVVRSVFTARFTGVFWWCLGRRVLVAGARRVGVVWNGCVRLLATWAVQRRHRRLTTRAADVTAGRHGAHLSACAGA
eukprot:6825065-Prymnesium_polylepis.2